MNSQVSIIGRWRGNNLVWRFQEGKVKHFIHDKKLRAWISRNMEDPFRYVDVVRRNQTEAYWMAWKKDRGIKIKPFGSKFVYTVNFWNPETDEEIDTWFYAKDWFEAEETGQGLGLKGYKRGVVSHVDGTEGPKGYIGLDLLTARADFYNPVGDIVQA